MRKIAYPKMKITEPSPTKKKKEILVKNPKRPKYHPKKSPFYLSVVLLFLSISAFAGNDTIVNDKNHPVPVSLSSGSVMIPATVTVNKITAAAHVASAHVTASVTAGTLVAANATRRSVVCQNLDTTITVWVGPATVTTSNGIRLQPGQSVSIDSTALIQVIAESGSPVVAEMETYD